MQKGIQMTNQEMVLDMLERQHKYDRAIEKAHGIQIRALGSDRLKAALLDEVGELNHAMKSRWCWWKKTQAPEDRDEVLEELADVWHFALMIILQDRKSVV